MLKKFKPNDLFYNRIKAHPECKFFFYNGLIFYNEKPDYKGQFSGSAFPNKGKVNLYELNVDRTSQTLIYPFLTKNGSLTTFKTVSTTDFNSDFTYGDTITGSYPLEAGITKRRYTVGESRPQIDALENTLNYYMPLSCHFEFNGTKGDKSTQELSQIDVPSIFYGSSIKKGTVSLKYYKSGSLIAELQDNCQNGELKQIGPVGSIGSGSVAGVVLYNEGFMILTGSWTLNTGFQWKRFAAEDNFTSSFDLSFEGTNYVSTVTMLCHAPKGEFNYSNNPTYLEYGQTGSLTPITSSNAYREHNTLRIKNIVESPFADPTGSFQKQTYISRVGIYDENRNLIAVAKMARPIRKREIDDFTVKLKLDI